ncbi:CsgBAC operon transcriptional regulatory protein [Polaromonas vacuolata]|uniref:CsgBAC operon transcriptional regulatory protein n=1 Tax=Polaromonas vacuolata TaxID=37448 RepID=A0A6H2H860_9BURK|nr:LuxR C-terminal-related transcriptional regulator [Polaromonas vacuolata]QJC55957.1 CsgBAC operon transcriptional regulatory protein [Polaromonas vacuolata]
MLNITTPSHGHFACDSVIENSLSSSVGARHQTNAKHSQTNAKQKILKVDKTLKAKATARPLSSIEIDLLNALHTGASNRKIALERGKSTYTVRNQLSTLYAKIGVTNRIQALVWLQTSTASLVPIDERACNALEKKEEDCAFNCLTFDLLNLHNIFGKPIVVLPLSCGRDSS